MICGTRYWAGSTRVNVTYYYPRCQCVPKRRGVKRRRQIDIDSLDAITRRVHGV